MANARKRSGNPAKRATTDQKGVSLYHVMREDEDFETTADILFQMVRMTATKFPGKPRFLHLDIDGHRNEQGGWDTDAYEIQKEFLLGYLGRWLTEIHTPVLQNQVVRTPEQHEDLPERLTTLPGGLQSERAELLATRAREFGRSVYDADSGETVHPDDTRSQH